MDTGGFLECGENPPLFLHGDFKSVDVLLDVGLVGEGDRAGLRVSEQLELIDLGDFLSEVFYGTDNLLGLFSVAFFSEDFHGVPGSDDWGGAPGTSWRGGGVETAWPEGVAEVAGVHEVSVLEHNHRDSLGCHSVLVVVAGDGSDSWDGEVEIGDV